MISCVVVHSMAQTMHGHRQTKLLARYIVLRLYIQAPLCGHQLNTNASLLRTAFFVPVQSAYILTHLIRTLKSFFVSVSMKIAETLPNVSLSTGSLNN